MDEIKEIKGVCPSCGKEISIEDGIDVFFCKYCGTKIDVKLQAEIEEEEKAKLEKYKKPREPITFRSIMFNPIFPALIFILFGLGIVWYATTFKM